MNNQNKSSHSFNPLMQSLERRLKPGIMNYIAMEHPSLREEFETQEQFDQHIDSLIRDVVPLSSQLFEHGRHLVFQAYHGCMSELIDTLGISHFQFVMSVMSQEFTKEYLTLEASGKLKETAIHLARMCEPVLEMTQQEDFTCKSKYHAAVVMMDEYLQENKEKIGLD